MWRYGVGHSQLLLRSTPEGTESTCLDLHFEGVAAVQLGIRYVAPRLRPADRHERATLKALAQTGAGPRRVGIAIESETGSGLVLCSKVSVLRGGADAFGGVEQSETLWSHPPGLFWDAPLSKAVWSELTGPARTAMARQIARTGDDHERERWGQPHRDHVRRNELAEADSGVETAGRQIDHLLARGDLQLDFRIGLGERSDDRLEDQRHHPPRHGKAQ